MGLDPAGSVAIDPEMMVPAAGQGIVGVTVRADNTELHELLAAIEDPEARAVSSGRTRHAGGAGRVLPHADRRSCAAAGRTGGCG